MADYKDKIRKLLALAQSPEEAEAKAALLRARELMAQHKLTEADLEEAKKQAVRDVKTDITCSKRRDPWIVGLSAVIGEHYCCKGYRSRYHGQQTQTIGFIGLEDDVEVCMAIFKYAVDCISAGVKKLKKELDGHWNEAMELAVKYGFITQAYGGTATLATHKNQLEAFRAENYIRRQRDMNGIDMEVQA